MKYFILMLIIEYPLCLLVQAIQDGRTETLARLRTAHVQVVIIAIVAAILILFCGFRYEYYGDAVLYTPAFESWDHKNFKEIWEAYKVDETSGPGFYFLSKLFKLYISDNIHWYFVFIATLSIVPTVITYYRYSEGFEFAIMIYILIGAYFMNFTALKQVVAAAFVFCSFPLIFKRKWYIYLPLVFLFSQFHSSAKIFLVVYFLAAVKNEKLKKYMPLIVIVAGFFLAVTYPVTGPVMARLMGEANEEAAANSSGGSPIRAILALVPLVLGWIFQDKIRPKVKYFDIIMVMSAFSVVGYTLCIFYWIYARFSIYFVPYSILLYCWVVKYGVSKKQRLFWYLAILIGFTAYFWYDMTYSVGYLWNFRHFYWKFIEENPYWYIDKYK